ATQGRTSRDGDRTGARGRRSRCRPGVRRSGRPEPEQPQGPVHQRERGPAPRLGEAGSDGATQRRGHLPDPV
ncbi:MAG: hypothetical protein AVDCRST_MAG49-3032, partial [uncultured Thermomicrobiales bacterium]